MGFRRTVFQYQFLYQCPLPSTSSLQPIFLPPTSLPPALVTVKTGLTLSRLIAWHFAMINSVAGVQDTLGSKLGDLKAELRCEEDLYVLPWIPAAWACYVWSNWVDQVCSSGCFFIEALSCLMLRSACRWGTVDERRCWEVERKAALWGRSQVKCRLIGEDVLFDVEVQRGSGIHIALKSRQHPASCQTTALFKTCTHLETSVWWVYLPAWKIIQHSCIGLIQQTISAELSSCLYTLHCMCKFWNRYLKFSYVE